MAFIVRKPGRRSELRESATTPQGTRSRTLATFHTLSPSVLAHAEARAAAPLDGPALRREARRVGIPVALPPAEQAARTLASELAQGGSVSPALRGVLVRLLAQPEPAPVSDAADAAAQWADASLQERGEALHDLLLLADALPAPRAERPERFPVLHSRADSVAPA